MLFDTIAAISTPRGEGGIGIVRISAVSYTHLFPKKRFNLGKTFVFPSWRFLKLT